MSEWGVMWKSGEPSATQAARSAGPNQIGSPRDSMMRPEPSGLIQISRLTGTSAQTPFGRSGEPPTPFSQAPSAFVCR